jgi:hypothetical protein
MFFPSRLSSPVKLLDIETGKEKCFILMYKLRISQILVNGLFLNIKRVELSLKID